MSTHKLINKTNAKSILKEKGMQLGKDLMEELDANTERNLREGMKRAEGNNRKTVFPKDL